jgi:hypothetical protein
MANTFPKKGKTGSRPSKGSSPKKVEQDVDSFMKRVAPVYDSELEATERQLTGWYGKKPRPEPEEPKGAPNLQGSHPLRVR